MEYCEGNLEYHKYYNDKQLWKDSLLTAILGLGIIVYAIFHSTIEPKKDSKKDDKIVAEASAIIETNGKDEENK